MKIEIADDDRDNPRSVKVVHDGNELFFNVATYTKTYDRSESVNPHKMFDELNEYWATCTNEQLNRIWDVYMRSHQALKFQTDINVIEKMVRRYVAEMYAQVNLSSIRDWVVFKSNILIPSSLKDQYEESELQDYRDRTYLRSHYIDLVAMTLGVRMMVPLWGEFIGVSEGDTGQFKEYVAMKLLYDSHIVVSPAMTRLRDYVRSTIVNSKENNVSAAAILVGISTTELPDYVTAMAVVRRLAIGDVSPPDENSHIITNIHQYIGNTLRSLDRKFGGKQFGGRVTDKNEATNNRNGPDEQTVSVAEMYKVKQEVPDGELVALSVYTENVHAMAAKVDASIDPALVDACLASVMKLDKEPVLKHQVTLVQWTLKDVLPTRAGESLDKPAIMRAMAVTQALLWHWGYFDIAALVTATALPITNSYGYGGGIGDGRGRIPKELMDQLQLLFPHFVTGKGKQQSLRSINVGSKAIDTFADIVTASNWRLNCPNELVEKTNRIENTKRMLIPGDLRIQLGRLILFINTGNKEP
jgi:hypothetical protein